MATLVSLATVKLHLRKGSDTSEDTLIDAYRAAAIAWVEKYTGHILVQREVVDTFAAWGDYLSLTYQPITVGDPTPTLVVTYNDAEGDETTYGARVIRDQKYPWLIVPPYGDAFPTLGDNGAISVTYTAGYDAGEVPDELNAAVLLLCEHWHTNRGAAGADELYEAPLAVKSLCLPFRGVVVA